MKRFSVGRRWLRGLAALLMCSSASRGFAYQTGIVANDAVVLAPPASALDVPASPRTTPNPPGEAAVADAERTAAAESGLNAPLKPSEIPAVVRSSNESMGLGLPATPLESKKSEATAEPSPSWLSSFDPRKNEITRVLGALAVVIGLILLGRAFLRRAGGGGGGVMSGGERPSGVVEILARYPVARGQQMILMKIARRIVLLHHAGTTMTPISEITDTDEVAGLLGRMEAGSNQRSAAKFRQTLAEFHAEHETATRFARPRSLPRGETQVIDLTRSQGKGIGRILGKRASR